MYAGHVHAYERNYQTLNYKLQGCAPRWITMGESAAACLCHVGPCRCPASVCHAALLAFPDPVMASRGHAQVSLGAWPSWREWPTPISYWALKLFGDLKPEGHCAILQCMHIASRTSRHSSLNDAASTY